MARDLEVAIFDEAGTDTLPAVQPPAHSSQVAVIDNPEPIEPTDDDHAISQAIANVAREPRYPVAPRPAAPAPATAPQPKEQQGQEGRQQDLPPEAQAILRELQQERRARRDAEQERDRLRNPQGDQQQNQPKMADLLFENPDAWMQQAFSPVFERLNTMAVEVDMKLARLEHGKETFGSAWEAFNAQCNNPERPDPVTYFRIMNAPSPGEELVAWFKERSTVEQVGNDPDAYRAKLRDEMLQDPAFLAEFSQRYGVEIPQAQPQPRQAAAAEAPRDPRTGQFQPRQETRLPTATSRLRGSASIPQGDLDGSDDAIFDAGRAPRR